jgi:membrane protease YdiL (CAAX protease family)
MSQTPPGPDPQIPAPPPPAPPPGYYGQGTSASAGWGAAPGQYEPPARWRSLRGLTVALTVLFVIHIVLAVPLIIGVIYHLSVLGDNERNGIVIDTDAVNDAQNFPGVILLFVLLVGIATFVLLIIWLYRAARNNEALGRQNPRLGPGWAIGGWFIPIAWWVIPFVVMDDVWRGSDPSVPRGDPNWRRSSTLGAIWAWLVTSVIFSIPNLITFFSGDVPQDEPERVRRDDVLRIIGAIGTIIAAVFAIIVIRRIAARQEECLRAQQAAAPAAPAS